MPDFNVEKKDWANYLEWVSKGLSGGRAEIDVLGLDIGAQVEARSLPLLGLTYDRKSDVIEVVLDGLDHMIHHPRELTVHEDDDGVMSFRVVGEDDVAQLIKLRGPLNLPAPTRPEWRNEPAKSKVGKH